MEQVIPLHNAIIIMPMGLPWNWSTDYYEQTAKILAGTNTVFLVETSKPNTIKFVIQHHRLPHLVTKLQKNIYKIKVMDFIPFSRFSVIKNINAMFYGLIARYISTHTVLSRGKTKIVLWIFDPQYYGFCQSVGQDCRVVYDVVDYYLGVLHTPEELRQIKMRDRALVKRADIVSVNSQTLYKLYNKIRSDILLSPQGFRLESFIKNSHFHHSPAIRPSQPVVGYVGGINQRLDFPLLKKIILAHPKCQFVFAGQIQKEQSRTREQPFSHLFDEITSLPNVIYIGNISKHRIPALIRSFDLCMIPYDSSLDFNQYCFPMKLFEYFYMGKPVLSTRIKELQLFPEYVYVGNSAQEWSDNIKTILSTEWPKSKKILQRRIAEKNSWARKVHWICEALKTKVQNEP